MRSFLVLLSFSVVGTGCSSPRKGDVAVAQQSAQTQSGDFAAFVDEFCGRWAYINRASPTLYSEFHQRTKELEASAVSDFPFRVLSDRQLVECWPAAAETVAFGGSVMDIERLLGHFDDIRPGQWSLEPEGALNVAIYGSMARVGLGLSVHQLEGNAELGNRIVDHLAACARPGYWRSSERQPVLLPAWYPGQSIENMRQSLAYHQSIRCVDALGSTGSSAARSALMAYNEEAVLMPEWKHDLKDGRVGRITNAISVADRVEKEGLTAFLSTSGAAF